MFEWNAAWNVGIGSIDAQHQDLFAIARELQDAIANSQSKAKMSKTLDRLIRCTTAHFADEERLMRLVDYPGLESHKGEHEALTLRVLEWRRDVAAGRNRVSVQVLQFLRTWMQQHIQHSDAAYAPYLKQTKVA